MISDLSEFSFSISVLVQNLRKMSTLPLTGGTGTSRRVGRGDLEGQKI